MRRLRTVAALLLVLRSPLVAPSVAQGVAQSGSQIPAKLSDSEFWKLISDISEANGYFRSDNFVSNETTFQWVIPELLRTTRPGGVYLGVGPDQNFPYITALKPKIAIIFDIRRQNMLTHLMYKAVIEQSADRADFVARLFARPRPAGLDTAMRVDSLLIAFQGLPPDSAAYRKELASIFERLMKTHGFALSPEDTATIAYVYQSFVAFGPDIAYDSRQRVGFGRGRMPSYAQLQIESDSAGIRRGYLSTEANFRALKAYEINNLIVPVVGDFAGQKAIRAVGDYLRKNQATVTAFYLSNVEQYLFNQSDDWKKFFTNVGTLPLDSSSTFIRSSFNGMGPRTSQSMASYMRSQQLLASMTMQLKLFTEGKITYYGDVLNTSR
jgi:hypothetical protein